MTIRYTDKPYGGYGPKHDDWQTRFPSHSRPIDTAPQSSRPIKLYEPDGTSRWGLYHLGSWRGGENRRDPWTGKVQWVLDGSLINNPIRWSSS